MHHEMSGHQHDMHDMHDMGDGHMMHMGNLKQLFWVSLIATIPILLLSPFMGMDFRIGDLKL
ncbi:MAG: hypothetical protein LKH41_03070, partial [Pediococcus pentosaceus]|nr:hypothetical protein [Pediococcus pentosaceus]